MINGERIRFRGVEKEDLPTFVRWINDPEVTAGLGIYLPFSQVEEEHWFETMLTHPMDEHVLAIEVREPGEKEVQETWKLIGSIGFASINWRVRMAELGINIGEKSYWNRGYGTEAVRLLTRHGFYTLNLHRIFLRVLETNPRAIRAYEKAGFIHEGRQRKAEYKNGEFVDLLVMSMLREEFKP